jgi:TorA-specific chaperone
MRAIEADGNRPDAALHPAVVYDWLSALFAREVPAEALRACAGGEPAEQLEILAQAPGLAALTEHLRALSADADDAARNLAGDFAFLFLGVGGARGAPPYESSWRDPDRLTCRAEEAWMRRLLRDLDMHVAADFPEPADHVAVQLAAMAELSRRAEHSRREAEQAATLAARMAEWLPAFAHACRRGDRRGFYSLVAEAAAAFVDADSEARGGSVPRRPQRHHLPADTGGRR